MLIDDLKGRITAAMKSGDTLTRDVLRLALSEIQRKHDPATDEAVTTEIRKLIKSNDETIALAGEGDQAATLRRENEALSSLLPKQLSVDAIVAVLATQHDAIKAAKSDGQATGIAMKELKAAGASVAGNDVSAAVRKIRS